MRGTPPRTLNADHSFDRERDLIPFSRYYILDCVFVETFTDSRFRCIMNHPIAKVQCNQLLSMTWDSGGIHIPRRQLHMSSFLVSESKMEFMIEHYRALDEHLLTS